MLAKKMYRPDLFLLFVILFCNLFSVSVAAEETQRIGKVIALRGQAVVTTEVNASRQVAIGSEISIADVINTGRRCRMQIMFADSTIVSLGPVSEFVVKEYAWNEQTQKGKMTSRVNEGVFRVLGGSITKSSPQNFTTETPSATIGIRGSMYAGQVRDGKLAVVFQGGKGIYVRNPLGSVELSIPGYGTKLESPGQAPQEPYQFTPEEVEQLDPTVAAAPPLSDESPAEDLPASGEIADTAGENELISSEPAAGGSEPAPVAAEPIVTELPVEIEPPAQTVLTDTVLADTTIAAGSGGTATLSGQYLAVLQEDLNPSSGTNQSWVGSLSGLTSADQLTGTASNSPTPSIGPYTVTGYIPNLSYTGVVKHPVSRVVTLLGAPTSFSAEIINDNTGEFSVLNLAGSFNSPTQNFYEIGFLGTPTLALPTSGINWFTGPLAGTLDNVSNSDFEGFGNLTDMVVNWANGKIFGVVQATGPNAGVGFYFGNIIGTGFNVTHFFGNDIVNDVGPGSILAIDGSSSFGQFYGNQASGFGLVAAGNTYLVDAAQNLQENWQLVAAGFRDAGLAAAPAGTALFDGYAVGVGENMAMIDVNRRLFMNNSPTEFSLSVNRNTGTINGSLTAFDLVDPSVSISSLTVGGTNGSVYISDDIFAAIVGGGTIWNGASSGGLKAQGNFLLTEDPSKPPIATYASWGSWEIAYADPNTGDDYHVHVPSTYWVAGEMTSSTDLVTVSGTATYNCRAEGVYVPISGPFDALPSGTVTLNVDFDADMLTSGTLSFPAGTINPAINLNIPSVTVATGQFTAPLVTPGGTINGAFYGPAADSVAGNFEAQLTTPSARIIGIFGGDR